MTTPTTTRVAIYSRVSTDRQSSDNQLRELRTFCRRNKWKIVEEYIDHESGRSSDRAQFKKMFEDAHRRHFDLVLFWALDRFSREGVIKTLNYLNQLEHYNVHYKSYTEQYFDSAGMFKDAIVAIMATLAKQESVRLGERVRAGMARAKASGKRISRPPLSAEKQAQIRELKAQGLSNREVARQVGVVHKTVAKVLDSG